MIFNLFQRFKSKKVLKNFISLVILQGTNFLIPVFLMPYIIRVIGLEKFGFVSIIQVVMIYLSVFTDYGFNITATRKISFHKEEKGMLDKIFSTVLATKLMLGIIGFALLLISVMAIDSFRAEWQTWLLSYSIVIGQILLPIWFYQGVEQMKYITYLNLVSKIFFVGLILILIRSEGDYIYYLFLLGLGNIISGILGILFIIKKFNLKIYKPEFFLIKDEIKKGAGLFLSNFSVISFMNSNIIILSFFVDNLIVGYYSIAEKVVFAFWNLIGAFSSSIFPHICSLTLSGHSHIKAFFIKVFPPFIFIVFVVYALIYVLADNIILILSGSTIPMAAEILRMLSIVLIILAFYNFHINNLLAYGLNKQYSFITIATSILNIVFNIILANYFSAFGTVTAVLITQLIMAFGVYYYVEIKYKDYSLILN